MDFFTNLAAGAGSGATIGGGIGAAGGPAGAAAGAGTGALIGAGVALLPEALKGGAYALDRYRKWKNPYAYRRDKVLGQMNLGPEAYELQKQNLSKGLKYLSSGQNTFQPRRVLYQQGSNIAGGLPQTVGDAPQVQKLTGLAAMLQSIKEANERGYRRDYGQLSSQVEASNPLGLMGSDAVGAFNELYNERARQSAQSQLGALSDYARQNAIVDIENQNLGLGQIGAQTELQSFLSGLNRAETGMSQQDFLRRQEHSQGQSNLLNRYGSERYRQGVQQYRMGNQPVYNLQQQRS